MKNILKKILLTTLLILPLFAASKAYAQETNSEIKFTTYFTGIGCPHCAIASPYIKETIDQDSNFIVIEYELYKQTENAKLISQYHDTYDLGLGIPVVLFNKENIVVGDSDIKNNLKLILSQLDSGLIQTPNEIVSIEDFSLEELDGYPRIYRKDRVAIRQDLTQLSQEQNDEILSFLLTDLKEWTSEKRQGEIINPQIVEYPGGSVSYQHALKVNGWLLQWNGDIVQTAPEVNPGEEAEYCEEEEENVCPETISIPKILGLALADSINPCAISVLLLMLIAITTYNPKDIQQSVGL
jgi:glutaredoxin